MHTIGFANTGPDAADTVTVTDVLPAGTTFASLSDGGLTCTTPAVGSGGTVSCTVASVLAGASGSIVLGVTMGSSVAAGPILDTATISSATDSNIVNNQPTRPRRWSPVR